MPSKTKKYSIFSFEVKIGTYLTQKLLLLFVPKWRLLYISYILRSPQKFETIFHIFPILNIGYSAFVVLCNCIKLRKNRVKVMKSKIGIILYHLMIYRNYFRFWNWLENFKSMVLSRDLRQTLLLWASMGLSGSKIQTGSRTETEMDVVANRMSVLSGNVQVALCFHRKIRTFYYKIFLISVSVNKVKLFKY